MEVLTLTTPQVTPQITTTDYRVASTLLRRLPQWLIVVDFAGTNGETRQWRVDDPVRAQTLIVGLNKANLGTKSLERRCFEFAQADGVFSGTLAGTITGAPD